jgi:hypothetical protein
MSFAPDNVCFVTGDSSILGSFHEVEFGNFFEFSKNKDEGIPHLSEYPHRVWVTTPREGIDHGFRYAIVKKTVAYIVVDEDDYGVPVVEKWKLKNKNDYIAP